MVEDNKDNKTELGSAAVPKSPGDSGPVKDLSAVKTAVAGKRGRPLGSGKGKRAKGLPPELDESLFKGKAWAPVACLPFNVRQVMTGSEIFTLNDEQKDILGSSLGAIMRSLGIMNPAYLALTVFSVNMASIFAEKEIEYAMSKPKKKKEDKKEV